MRILIVCSGNKNRLSPFVKEQCDSLIRKGLDLDFFFIVGKGAIGYLKNIRKLRHKINEFKPNIVHAHYGLSGLLCILQRKVPLVVTYHGSDINNSINRIFSRIVIQFAHQNIFVSEKLLQISKSKTGIVIPCGLERTIFYPRDKNESREKLGLDKNKKYILFSSHFKDLDKNYSLAKKALKYRHLKAELIELKDFSREEVALLLNAVDAALLTSLKEGSPQFIKEAMACDCPIVSTDVGDIRQNIGCVTGCYITSFSAKEINEKISLALTSERTNGHLFVEKFDNNCIADEILKVYTKLKLKGHVWY